MLMQNELDSMRTNHGTRMGLPTFVRQVAAVHVQTGRESKQRGMHTPEGLKKEEEVAANT
eukprot:scaffold264653_cov48-Prasinocladus_malaysianus.AAC.1